MEVVELFYPQISVQVGNYQVADGIELKICSDMMSYFDWAKIKFTEQMQPALTLAKKDPAKIFIGYDGVMEEVFSGFVSRPYNGVGADEIALKDEMVRLEETIVNHTFLDTTPQEIIAFCLNRAGVTKMQLSTQNYQARRQAVFQRMTVIEAINRVHAIWGIKQHFFFLGGTFYWGVKPAQEKVYTFEHGVNILSLDRFGGMWELETVAAPFVHHSQRVEVIHPKISGTVEVQKVITGTNDHGFIRTRIYF